MRPTRVFFTKGTGVHREDKNARDAASFVAGLADKNIVDVSSVLPAGIRAISRDEFLAETTPGEVVFAINGICQTNVEGQIASAGLAYAIPDDPEEPGYITELFEEPGIHPEVLKRRVETMALQLFATRTNVEGYVAGDEYEAGRTRYRVGAKDVTLGSLIAYDYGKGMGNYTCALVAAVLLP